MCYQLGWMKGQRLDKYVMELKDRDSWLKISEDECARLPHMVKGGLDESSTKLTIGYMQDDNERISRAASCLKEPLGAPCTKATVEDWVYHVYPKCLLGGGNRLTGAATQVA